MSGWTWPPCTGPGIDMCTPWPPGRRHVCEGWSAKRGREIAGAVTIGHPDDADATQVVGVLWERHACGHLHGHILRCTCPCHGTDREQVAELAPVDAWEQADLLVDLAVAS